MRLSLCLYTLCACATLLLLASPVRAQAALDSDLINFNPDTASLVIGGVELTDLVEGAATVQTSIAEVESLATDFRSVLSRVVAPRWKVADNTVLYFDFDHLSGYLSDFLATAVLDPNDKTPLYYELLNGTALPSGLVLLEDGSVGGSIAESLSNSITPGTRITAEPFTIQVTNAIGVTTLEPHTFVIHISRESVIQGPTGSPDPRFGWYPSGISFNGSSLLVGAPWHLSSDGGAYSVEWNTTRNAYDPIVDAGDAVTIAGAGSRYGNYVSLTDDGLTALVTFHLNDDLGSNTGAAAFLSRASTNEPFGNPQTVYSDDPTNLYFGISGAMLSADGAVAVVGHSQYDTAGYSKGGAVHVFRHNGTAYEHKQRVVPTTGGAVNLYFGTLVALSHDAQYLASSTATNPGVVYIHKYDDVGSFAFEEMQILTDSSRCASVNMNAISFSGGGAMFAVGRWFCGNLLTGEVMLYKLINPTTYAFEQAVVASDGHAYAHFGKSVALSRDGSTLVVGATNHNNGDILYVGAVYVFFWQGDGSKFVESRKVMKEGAITSTNFGESVTISGDGSTCVASTFRSNFVATFKLVQ